MAQDFAPWDNDYREVLTRVRARVLAAAASRTNEHATLPLQGCGHFITEAALRSFLPPGGRILIPRTGAYADRMIRLATEAGRVPVVLDIATTRPAPVEAIVAALAADPSLTHAGLVYSETGSGVIHEVPALGRAIHRLGRRVIVDAVSAFGALPLDLSAQPEVDAVVFTSNKCIEGLPGMAFAVARIDRLEAGAGNAGSWSLDLCDIYRHALRSGWGSFRFTPPAQVLASFDRALDFWESEGRPARLARYIANKDVLYDGILALGLRPWLDRDIQGPVVMNVHAPDHPAWDLQRFVDSLKRRGVLISNFYNTPTPSFRIGCIGAIGPEDMRRAVAAMGEALGEIGISRREGSP